MNINTFPPINRVRFSKSADFRILFEHHCHVTHVAQVVLGSLLSTRIILQLSNAFGIE